VAALKETATKSGNRMAFITLEDMVGAVDVTVFPEPFKAAAPYLRSREPLVVRGRVDDGDKGRVILAEDVRLLEQALGGARPRPSGSEPGACRVRVAASGDPQAQLVALRKVCEAHPGGVPVFVHIVLDGQEVVIRSRGCSVDATPELTSDVEALLGRGALTIDYARRPGLRAAAARARDPDRSVAGHRRSGAGGRDRATSRKARAAASANLREPHAVAAHAAGAASQAAAHARLVQAPARRLHGAARRPALSRRPRDRRRPRALRGAIG